jgi:hypothetical protein
MMNHDFASRILSQWTDGNISVFNGSSHAIEAGSEISAASNFPGEKFLYIYGFAL